MSMTINKELPNPAALKAEFPVPEHIKEIKAARDKEIAGGGDIAPAVDEVVRALGGFDGVQRDCRRVPRRVR